MTFTKTQENYFQIPLLGAIKSNNSARSIPQNWRDDSETLSPAAPVGVGNTEE